MALPTGVTVVNPTPVTQILPTRINTTAAATPTLVSTYFAPFMAALNITAPSGYQVSGFNFHLNPDGSSVSTISWSVIPAPTPAS